MLILKVQKLNKGETLMKLATQSFARLLSACVLCFAFAAVMMAQDRTITQTTPGTATSTTTVERGEVAYVSGNDLVVKMENGEVRHLTVPDTARATVDGKELSVHELKPGMKLQRTITTTQTPRTVTTIRTIQGKVVQVIPPLSLILSFPDGSPNKQYKIPNDQKFVVDGQSKTAFELKPGMNIGATVVTESSETALGEQRTTVGTAPAPPPAPRPATPTLVGVLLIEVPVATPAPVAARPAPAAAPAPAAPEPAPVRLPKTASPLPLIGLLGLMCFAASIGMKLLRRLPS
jgi:hypothetical protein